MEEQKFSLSGSFQKAKEYIDTQINLFKLKAIAKGSKVVGTVTVDLIKILLILIIVFFLSLALGFYLGELLGSYSLGFLTTGGIFLVFLLLIQVLQPKLEAAFRGFFIQRILGKWDEEDERLESMTREPNNSANNNEESN